MKESTAPWQLLVGFAGDSPGVLEVLSGVETKNPGYVTRQLSEKRSKSDGFGVRSAGGGTSSSRKRLSSHVALHYSSY